MSYGILDVAKDIVTGNVQYAEPSKQEERRNICKGCEFLQDSRFDLIGICGKCGCMMNQKTKFSQSTCIIGKW
ncbi:MAG: DUF6171 family protein [Bacteroidales bacterium]|jgi:hypothetical protein